MVSAFIYPTKYYNLTSATTTKHVFTPSGELIATLETVGATTTKHFTHPDHLGGTNVVTDENAEKIQTLDYYPFGSDRINTGTFSEQRTFIGEEHDPQSNLSYLNARYYDSNRGQFMTQDPAFLDIGSAEFETKYQRTLEQHLQNPQALDPYGYALNNPIKYTDPSGEVVPVIVWGAIIGGYSVANGLLTAYDLYLTHVDAEQYGGYRDSFTNQDRSSSKNRAYLNAILSAAPGLGQGAGFFGQTGQLTLNYIVAGVDVIDTYFGNQTSQPNNPPTNLWNFIQQTQINSQTLNENLDIIINNIGLSNSQSEE